MFIIFVSKNKGAQHSIESVLFASSITNRNEQMIFMFLKRKSPSLECIHTHHSSRFGRVASSFASFLLNFTNSLSSHSRRLNRLMIYARGVVDRRTTRAVLWLSLGAYHIMDTNTFTHGWVNMDGVRTLWAELGLTRTCVSAANAWAFPSPKGNPSRKNRRTCPPCTPVRAQYRLWRPRRARRPGTDAPAHLRH